MNWFLLLLILKLFTNIWAAPIDLLEVKDDIQVEQNISNGFINNNLNGTIDQANTLLKTAEDELNSSSLQLTENLNENTPKISTDLHNFTAEEENVVESNFEKETTEKISEVTTTTEVNGDEIGAMSNSVTIIPHEEIEHEEISLTTESPLEISRDVGDSVNFSSEPVLPANAEPRNNADIILTEPAVTEFVSNDVKTSTEVGTIKDVIGTPANEESLIESMEILENKTDESTEKISTTLNEFETEKVSSNSQDNLEHTTQASNPEATTTPNTPTIVEILNENVEQIYNLSEKLVESSVSNQDSTTVNDLEETFTPTTEEISATSIENNNNVNKQSAMEVTTHHYPEVSSTETPALKETVDSFINQVTNIGSSIGKEAEELRFDASMIHAATENFINPESPVVMQENMTESQKPLVAEYEDNSEKAPTFKEAVDSFIEEVVEIGSKLGLIPEEKPVKEIPTTTEPLSELINIATTPAPEMKETAESNDSSTDSPVLEMEGKTEEIIINATTPSLEILAENQNNNSDLVQNSENSNFGRSAETLIEAASEIGNNFSKTFSNLFTTNENEPETNKLNESLMGKTSSAEQSNSENSEISSTQVPIVTFQGDFPKYSIINHENIEVPSTTPAEESTETIDEHHENKEDIPKDSENITQKALQQTPEDIKPKEEEQFGKHESLSYPAEEITKTSEDLSENKEDMKQENENFTKQIVPQTPEDIKPTEEEQSAKYAEYIPVAVITIPEDEGDSTKQNEHSEPQILFGETNETRSEPEPQASQGEESIDKNEQLEKMNSEQPTQTNEENESEKASENMNQDVIHKTEEYTSLAPTSQETTTTNSPVVIVEETTHALNKFENTLKTLIEQEKLKHEERHATALETNQQETTTLAPTTKSSIAHQEEPTITTTTTQSLEETTMLPKKFEEELQMAVKALEETTHHHFEEFQSNLKEAFKKFTVWGAEHERPETTTSATTTIFKTELNEATTTETETTQQSLSEQPTTMMPEVDNNQDKTDVVLEETLKTEEPHRIGVINQNFVDKFADNYVESPVATNKETQMVKEQSSQLSEMQESVIEMEQTTKTHMDLTTMLPVEDEIKSVPQEQEDVKTAESFMEVTSINNDDDLKEVLTPIAENIVKESNAESVETTTEYIAETSATPLLARVTLQKDFNSVSLVPDNEQNTVVPIQEPTALQPDSEQIKEIHTETTQNTEALEEATTLPTFETSVKEMVTFIEHNDTTTVKQEQENEEEDSVTTIQTQTQEPLTQASFMEEQQQQLESTTEHHAQTQTADASGQTATTTTVKIEDDDTYKQETTETDIHSTTVVEEDEMATTTAEPTAAPVEPEARSLSLPPPKLEYLQNEDGVEVFYGYSIVKHN